MQNARSREIISTLLLLLTAMIWGAAFVAQSVGADNVGAFTFLASRSWLAGVALLPLVAVMRRKTDRPSAGSGDRRTLITGGLLCGFFLFIASAAQQIGIATTTTAKAGFLTALYVIIVPILSIVVRKKVPVRVWISALIAVTGLYLLCMKGRFSLEAGSFSPAPSSPRCVRSFSSIPTGLRSGLPFCPSCMPASSVPAWAIPCRSSVRRTSIPRWPASPCLWRASSPPCSDGSYCIRP